jgi:WD40 repeat protein
MNLVASGVRQVLASCIEFERRWHTADRISIESQLEQNLQGDREAVLQWLLLCEFRLMQGTGQLPVYSHYAKRFPEDLALLEQVFRSVGVSDGLDLPQLSETVLLPPNDFPDLTKTEDHSTQSAQDTPVSISIRQRRHLLPGTRFGDCEIVDEIARGGMGVVYRARHSRLNRTVALKMILSAKLASDKDIVRFGSEAAAAARLEHPSIVPIHEFGDVDGQYFYSMPLIEGGSLAGIVKQGAVAPRQAAYYVQAIADAMQYAHSRNIVHRDLKPANVLLEKNGQPKITDFGLARDIECDSGMTATGAVLGTPDYMAPEQASGNSRDVGPLADIYAMGAILYSLLTGKPPFHGGTMIETLQRVITAEPVSPRQLNRRVDIDLETICLKCLQKDPARRFSSAGALAEELARYLAGKPISSRPIGSGERTLRWCRRHRLITGMIVATITIIILSAYSLYSRAQMAAAGKAVVAAEKLAKTQEYYSAWSHASEVRSEAALGWTWACLDGISDAMSLREAAGITEGLADLRSAAVHAMTSTDAQLAELLIPNVDCMRTAYSPDGKILAVGERRAGQSCSVHLIRMDDVHSVQTLSLSSLASNFLRFAKGVDAYADHVSSVAYSQDGRWLFMGTRYGMIYAWDLAATPQKLHSWKGYDGAIADLAVSPDGTTLFSRCEPSAELFRWSIEKPWEALPPLLADGSQVTDISFSQDGKLLAVAAAKTHLYDAVTLTKLNNGEPLPPARHLRFSQDNQTLALALHDASSILLMNVATREISRTLFDPNETGGIIADDLVFCGGDSLMVSVVQDFGLRLWETASGKLLQTIPLYQPFAGGLAVSPDGKQLAVGTLEGTQLVNIQSPSLMLTTAFSPMAVSGVAWHQASSGLVTTSFIKGPAVDDEEVAIWNTESGKQIEKKRVISSPHWPSMRAPSEGLIVAHPKDGSMTTNSRRLGLVGWSFDGQLGSGSPLLPPPNFTQPLEVPFEELGLATESDALAYRGRAVRLAQASGHTEVKIFLNKARFPDTQERNWACMASVRVTGAALSATALEITPANSEHSPRTISVPVVRTPPGYQWCLVNYDPQSRILASPENHTTISLPLDATTDHEVWIDRILMLPADNSRQYGLLDYGPMAISPAVDRIWAVVDDSVLSSWKTGDVSPSIVWRDLVSHRLYGDDVLRSIDVGTEIVAAGTRRGVIQLVDPNDGKSSGVLKGPGGPVNAVAITPDDHFLAIGSESGKLRVVDIHSPETVMDFEGHSRGIDSLEFSNDGEYLVSGARDKSLRLWKKSGTTWELVFVLRGFSQTVRKAVFSPLDQRLAILVEGERAVRVLKLNELNQSLQAYQLNW